jgi:hypothetical protein
VPEPPQRMHAPSIENKATAAMLSLRACSLDGASE